MKRAFQGLIVAGAVSMVMLSASASFAGYDEAAKAYGKGRFASAFLEYLTLAEKGDVRAQANVGWMYQAGEGTAADPVKAVAWYAKAAAGGHAIAQFNLGYAYEQGAGAPRDLSKASLWYARSAIKGNVEAQAGFERVQKLLDAAAFLPTATLEKGGATGVAAEPKVQPLPPPSITASASPSAPAAPAAAVPAGGKVAAAHPPKRSAAPPAVTVAVDSGRATPPKHKESAKIVRTRLAAEAGDVDAQVYLGWCYSSGLEVAIDKAQARVWYRLAAEQGNVSAQRALGWMYYNAEGVKRDFSESAAWYRLAAARGDRKAKLMLSKIASESRP